MLFLSIWFYSWFNKTIFNFPARLTLVESNIFCTTIQEIIKECPCRFLLRAIWWTRIIRKTNDWLSSQATLDIISRYQQLYNELQTVGSISWLVGLFAGDLASDLELFSASLTRRVYWWREELRLSFTIKVVVLFTLPHRFFESFFSKKNSLQNWLYYFIFRFIWEK